MTRKSKRAFAVRRCALASVHRHRVWLHDILELTCHVELNMIIIIIIINSKKIKKLIREES